jgi:nucleoside-diphosphate-sugar epimerase
MRMLVAGAAGFIGSHIAEAAVAAGHEVRAAILATDDPAPLRSLGLPVVTGDLTDPLVARRAVGGCEVVLNASGRAGDYNTLDELTRANVTTAEALVSAARDCGVRRFVHASSYMVSIGGSFQHWAGGVIDDRTPQRFEYWRWDFYGRSKVAAEQAIMRARGEGRLEVVILRIGWVYGPRDRTSFPSLVDIVRSGLGTVVGSGRNHLGLVYVTDVADAFLLAATATEAGGPFVVAGVADASPVTQAEYLNAIADLVGAHSPRIRVPFRLADGLGRTMETTWHRLGRPRRPLLTSFAVHLLGRDQVFDSDGVRAAYGWEPKVAFSDGIRRTMSWLQSDQSAPSGQVS